MLNSFNHYLFERKLTRKQKREYLTKLVNSLRADLQIKYKHDQI